MSCCICCVRMNEEGGDEADAERRPIVDHKQIHEHFRLGRNQDESRCEKCMKCVVKWSANCLGIWKPRRWGLILSTVFFLICGCQLAYDLMTVIGCRGFDCGFLEKEQKEVNKTHPTTLHKPCRETAKTVYTLASVGDFISYIVLLISLLRMEWKRDCALAPSEALRDLSRTQVRILFACLTILCVLFMTGVGLFYYIIRKQPKGAFFIELCFGVGSQFIAQWSAIVACVVFGASSFGLGTFADDTFRRLRDMAPGANLDAAIRIHEELCDIVDATVSGFRWWFVFHWLLYGATSLLSIVLIEEQINFGSPLDNLVYIGIFGVVHFFLFLSPCCSAAYITAKCGGVHSRVNKTTSTDWSVRHLFRDRAYLTTFNSYVKDRQCCFKIFRITFTSNLAWVSLLLGATGLLFHFF